METVNDILGHVNNLMDDHEEMRRLARTAAALDNYQRNLSRLAGTTMDRTYARMLRETKNDLVLIMNRAQILDGRLRPVLEGEE